MADTLEILRGISQVLSNKYDGAKDENGDPVKTGLKRDENVPFTDKRVIDGFSVKLSGDKLKLNYISEMLVSDIHDKKFKDDIHQTITDVVSFLKKEYKKVTGDTLSLKELQEPKIEMTNISRVRNIVQASCIYEIGGIEKMDKDDPLKKTHTQAIKDWIALGRKKERAPNDDR